MSVQMANDRKTERIDLRATPRQVDLIERAAEALDKDRTSFLLDAGMEAAEWALAERTTIRLDPEAWDEFMATLDRPVKPHPRLRRLFQEPSVLESE